MAMEIIPGRNDGYPCIRELPELRESAELAAPYPEYFFRAAQGQYPEIVSGGKLCLSELVSGEHCVRRLFFGDKPVKAAYIGNTGVFAVY